MTYDIDIPDMLPDYATPINGTEPDDLQFRATGDAVEQWSSWAGFWDLHHHEPSIAQAQAFVAQAEEARLAPARWLDELGAMEIRYRAQTRASKARGSIR